MWISKQYLENLIRQGNDLQKRVKRLEFIFLEESINKITSLQNKETGLSKEEKLLTIEEIINKRIGI